MRRCPVMIAVAAAAAFLCSPAAAQAPGEPGYGVHFNQHELEEIAGAPTLDIKDEMAVFGHIFAALPDEAKVYPTENYYYFTFVWGGVPFAGNLRLDAADRDDGVLHFAYFPKMASWTGDMPSRYRALTQADGVTVARKGRFDYAVSFKGKTTLFHLNDLSEVKPPDGAVREKERYLGPVFDESGLRFFLLFDETRKDFLFVLDEREPLNETLTQVHQDHPALTIGVRTGFAFFQDRYAPRKILVGVNALNVDLNTPLDGPFDQLPDNFMDDDELRTAMLERSPELEGQIDRFGGFLTGEGRVLVSPYRIYQTVSELEGVLRCSDPALDEGAFYRCLTTVNEP